ncbi:hypothetical protein [Streptomyces olivoreticuli]|uniref:hypothetical protein n=1 Tax=Streptomyces olivoreticuli TaxID=68246 RepID=UPI000E24CD48|nr:hypothetical protein [Streptomyces olivoreticuli]
MPNFPGTAMPSMPVTESSKQVERPTLQQKLKKQHPLLPSTATYGDPSTWSRDTVETYLDLAAAQETEQLTAPARHAGPHVAADRAAALVPPVTASRKEAAGG